MAALSWDGVGDRFFETGVDRGVLYIPTAGVYDTGVAWNGLVSVTQSPSGAESNKIYADNIPYLNLISAEEFAATIEAYTFPDEFLEFDGFASPVAGVAVGQQARKTFGLSYRSRVGNDVEGDELGYKLHLIYGCVAAPTERAHSSVNESPEATTFSWEVSTTPVTFSSGRPTSVVTVDSRTAGATELQALEDLLWGTDTPTDPSLPLPDLVVTTMTP